MMKKVWPKDTIPLYEKIILLKVSIDQFIFKYFFKLDN